VQQETRAPSVRSVDITIVSKVLRHSNTGITGRLYSHLLLGVGRDAAKRANKLVPRRKLQDDREHPRRKGKKGS